MSRTFLSSLLLTSALTLPACTTTESTASSAPATDQTAMPEQPESGSTPVPESGFASGTDRPDAATTGCNAEAARRFAGQTATADVVEQARQAAGAESARTLKPGQMVTMEFNARRLNIDVDANNMVTNVRCG